MVTWVTHNTRMSERMVEHGVVLGEPVIFSQKVEVLITKFILDIVVEDNLKVLAYNICRDHIHIILVCSPKRLTNIVRKLKGKSTQLLKNYLHIPKDEVFILWAQKFHRRTIDDHNYLQNALYYISSNREKHGLKPNKGLQPLVHLMLCDFESAFCNEE